MNDVWWLHIDSMGNILYENSIRTSRARVRGLVRNADGTFWLGLNIEAYTLPNYYHDKEYRKGVNHILILHLDSAANVLHRRTIGSPGTLKLNNLILLPSGNVVASIYEGGGVYATDTNGYQRSPGYPMKIDSLLDPKLVLMEFNAETDTTDYSANAKDKYKIYPNPNNGTLTIETPEKTIYDCTLYTIDGRVLYRFSFDAVYHQENISHLTSGLYIITIAHKGKTIITQKLSKY